MHGRDIMIMRRDRSSLILLDNSSPRVVVHRQRVTRRNQMKKLTIVVLAMLALTIGVYAQTAPPTADTQTQTVERMCTAQDEPTVPCWSRLSDSERVLAAACRKDVQDSLRTPDSAEFQGEGSVYVGRNKKKPNYIISGFLYARNGYGARIYYTYSCTALCETANEPQSCGIDRRFTRMREPGQVY